MSCLHLFIEQMNTDEKSRLRHWVETGPTVTWAWTSRRRHPASYNECHRRLRNFSDRLHWVTVDWPPGTTGSARTFRAETLQTCSLLAACRRERNGHVYIHKQFPPAPNCTSPVSLSFSLPLSLFLSPFLSRPSTRGATYSLSYIPNTQLMESFSLKSPKTFLMCYILPIEKVFLW